MKKREASKRTVQSVNSRCNISNHESFDPWTDAESFIEVAESNKLPRETVKPGVFRYDVLMRRMIQEIPYAQLVAFDDNKR